MLLALSAGAGSGCDSPNRGLLLDPGTRGTAGGGSSSASIAGTWRRTLVVQTSTDVITSETTWFFGAGTGCERTVVSNSVLQGAPVIQRSPCTYQTSGGQVTVRFATGDPVTYSASVSNGRLFLGGVEFVRIA